MNNVNYFGDTQSHLDFNKLQGLLELQDNPEFYDKLTDAQKRKLKMSIRLTRKSLGMKK